MMQNVTKYAVYGSASSHSYPIPDGAEEKSMALFLHGTIEAMTETSKAEMRGQGVWKCWILEAPVASAARP